MLTSSPVLPAAGETIPASDSEGDGGEAEGVFEGPHRERELFVLHQLARAYGTSPAVVGAVADEYNVDDGESTLWDGTDSSPSSFTVDAGKLTVSTSISRASAESLPSLTSHLSCNRLDHSSASQLMQQYQAGLARLGNHAAGAQSCRAAPHNAGIGACVPVSCCWHVTA